MKLKIDKSVLQRFLQSGAVKTVVRLCKHGAMLAIAAALITFIFYYARGYNDIPHKGVIGSHSFTKMNIVDNNVMHKYLQHTSVEVRMSTIKLNHNVYNINSNSLKASEGKSVITCNAKSTVQVSRDEKTYHDVRITMVADSVLHSMTVTDLETNIVKIYN